MDNPSSVITQVSRDEEASKAAPDRGESLYFCPTQKNLKLSLTLSVPTEKPRFGLLSCGDTDVIMVYFARRITLRTLRCHGLTVLQRLLWSRPFGLWWKWRKWRQKPVQAGVCVCCWYERWNIIITKNQPKKPNSVYFSCFIIHPLELFTCPVTLRYLVISCVFSPVTAVSKCRLLNNPLTWLSSPLRKRCRQTFFSPLLVTPVAVRRGSQWWHDRARVRRSNDDRVELW